MMARVPEQKDAVVYLRVSTKEQASGYSLDAQEADCAAYAADAGLDVKGVYRDTCTGTRKHRPGLDAAMDALGSGAVLIVWDLDRLGRNIANLMAIRDAGTIVHVVRKGGPLSTVEWGIYATLAQDEHERISRRTKAGMDAKMATGWKSGRGLTSEEASRMGRLGGETQANRSRTLNRIAAQVMQGLAEKGLTFRAIVAEVNAMGITTQRGCLWNTTSVQRLFRRHGLRVSRARKGA